MASIFINSMYLLGSIMALGLGVVIVKAVYAVLDFMQINLNDILLETMEA